MNELLIHKIKLENHQYMKNQTIDDIIFWPVQDTIAAADNNEVLILAMLMTQNVSWRKHFHQNTL